MRILCQRYRRRSLRLNAYGKRYGDTALCSASSMPRPAVRVARESARQARARAEFTARLSARLRADSSPYRGAGRKDKPQEQS